MFDLTTLVGDFRALFLLLFVTIFYSCESEVKNSSLYLSMEGFAQGTTFSITYKDSLKRDFSKNIKILLTEVDKELSTYDSASFISCLNSSKDTCFSLSGHSVFEKCYKKAAFFHMQTNKYFNPAIYPLVDYWGFYESDRNEIDEDYILDSILPIIQFDSVFNLSSNVICKKHSASKLDFNAIAQGYSVDIIADFLESEDVYNYLVEIGGEVRAKGLSSKNKYWRIGIEKPKDSSYVGQYGFQKIIELKNQSLATSGNYRKFKEINGNRYSHTIDPLIGLPADNSLLSVTIICSQAADADALATACMVMGREKAIDFVINYKNETLSAYFIYDSSGVFQEWSSMK